jgi:hypothetical protein
MVLCMFWTRSFSPRRGIRRRLLTVAALGTALSVAGVVLAGSADAATDNWVTAGSDRADPLTESQGLASVEVPAGSPNRYTGIGTIPADVSFRGWNHIGDPDALNGYYIEPYQRDSGAAKLFRVQAPDGTWAEYTHALASGEAINNSFVTISPDGAWMVAGEYGTMDRLLVYPAPGLNAGTSPARDLPLAFTIRLNAVASGCTVDARRLLCSSAPGGGAVRDHQAAAAGRPVGDARRNRRHRCGHGAAAGAAGQWLLRHVRGGGHRLRPSRRDAAGGRHVAEHLHPVRQRDLEAATRLRRRPRPA